MDERIIKNIIKRLQNQLVPLERNYIQLSHEELDQHGDPDFTRQYKIEEVDMKRLRKEILELINILKEGGKI